MFEARKLHAASRLFLNDVCYSSAVPYWIDPMVINYNLREKSLLRYGRMLADGYIPIQPYSINVPKRNNEYNKWFLPSVNYQIIVLMCVIEISRSVQDSFIDKSRVFSCHLNENHSRARFLEDSVRSWGLFSGATRNLCKTEDCILQFDIKRAYDSIRMDDFLGMFDVILRGNFYFEILKRIMNSNYSGFSGIPFLNDSVFFLGNAYLSRVDKIVSRHNANYIRFVDDYKIFSNSREDLESSYKKIQADLRSIGLEINQRKVFLGDSQNYLMMSSKLDLDGKVTGEYMEISEVGEGIEGDILNKVLDSLRNPKEFMHQGVGRMQISIIQRLKSRHYYGQPIGIFPTSYEKFCELLSRNSEALSLIYDRLKEFADASDQEWRLIWVLYVSHSVKSEFSDRFFFERIIDMRNSIELSKHNSIICRAWAKYSGNKNYSYEQIDDMFSVPYDLSAARWLEM